MKRFDFTKRYDDDDDDDDKEEEEESVSSQRLQNAIYAIVF